MDFDQKEMKQFLDIYPEPVGNEVMYVSLSVRQKYLPQELRSKYKGLEMFHRRYFPTFLGLRDYLRDIRVENGVLTDWDIPLEYVTVYVNIRPSSTRKAAIELAREILRHLGETSNEWFLSLESKYKSILQKTSVRRTLVDIDIDVDDPAVVEFFRPLEFHTIKTKSGYHLLVEKKNININLGEVVKQAQKRFGGEIIINSNAMIPLPGTLQAGHLVRFV